MSECENLYKFDVKCYYCVFMPLKEADVTKYGCLDESGRINCPVYKWSVKEQEDTDRN